MKKVFIALAFFSLLIGCEEGSDCPDCLDNKYQSDFGVILEEALKNGEPYSYTIITIGSNGSNTITKEDSRYSFHSKPLPTGLQITKNYISEFYTGTTEKTIEFFPYTKMRYIIISDGENEEGTDYPSIYIQMNV